MDVHVRALWHRVAIRDAVRVNESESNEILIFIYEKMAASQQWNGFRTAVRERKLGKLSTLLYLKICSKTSCRMQHALNSSRRVWMGECIARMCVVSHRKNSFPINFCSLFRRIHERVQHIEVKGGQKVCESATPKISFARQINKNDGRKG